MNLPNKLRGKFIRGFTLIETIVTIAVMLIITGGGIAAFVNFNDRQNIQVAANELQTMLRSAQIKARVGEDADVCRDTYVQTLRGYRVYVESGTNTAVLYTVCAVDKFSSVASRNYIERDMISFDSNISVSMQGGGDLDMEFLSLLGGVDGVGTVNISGVGGNVFSFEVTQGGEITEGSFGENL